MLNIENLLLGIVIVALQFLDWWTTKIFVSTDGVTTEENPFARKRFEKEGVTKKDLIPKLVIGFVGWIFMVILSSGLLRHKDFLWDILFGVNVFAMLKVILYNFSSILSQKFIGKYQILDRPTKDLVQEELQPLYIRSAMFGLCEGIFFLVLGIWIYYISTRAVILGVALSNFMFFFQNQTTNLRQVIHDNL